MADEDFDDCNGYDEDGEIDTGVQLGFIEDRENILFKDLNWENWDGGKIGGKPIWLNPIGLPSTEDLICRCCNSPMIFLLQIYCPLDDVSDAFHRSLYVFICKKKKCVDSGSVKCFRCQLGRTNLFYPYQPQSVNNNVLEEKDKNIESTKGLIMPRLCAMCGCKASNICSKCKAVAYCSREHQTKHWRDHKVQCSGITASESVSKAEADTILNKSVKNDQKSPIYSSTRKTLIFPEFDLSISSEILEDLEKVDALNKSVLEASIWENASAVEIDDGEDSDDEEKADEALTQTDYNQALGNEASDPVYTKFMERVRRGGTNQVVRYSRWDDIQGPLTLSSLDTSTDPRGTFISKVESTKIPVGTWTAIPLDSSPIEIVVDQPVSVTVSSSIDAPLIDSKLKSEESERMTSEEDSSSSSCYCSHCGAEKKFEFQIMPQLLHYLRVDRRTTIAQQEKETAEGKETQMGNLTAEKKEKALQLLLNKTDEDIDWGTIDIYTCTASCSLISDKSLNNTGSAYIEETIYVQKPLSFERSSLKKEDIPEERNQSVSECHGHFSSPSGIAFAQEIDL